MIRTALVIGVLVGLIGCGSGDEPPPTTCYVPPTSNVVSGDCKKKMSDGTECVTECGQLPQDGSPGTPLPVGCQVQIGTSSPETGTCVAACSDCP